LPQAQGTQSSNFPSLTRRDERQKQAALNSQSTIHSNRQSSLALASAKKSRGADVSSAQARTTLLSEIRTFEDRNLSPQKRLHDQLKVARDFETFYNE
jgi:hypothetical protein